jgi:glyoxylase-like metal-dependent hydrolase (beta-lactamase superfamily II)
MLGRRQFFLGCACCAGVVLAPRAWAQGAAEDAVNPAQSDFSLIAAPRLEIAPIADNVWLHTSWRILDGAPFPSNGLFVKGARSALLIDTAWSLADTPVLLDRVAALAPGMPMRLVVTHAHADRMSGIDAARERGVRSLAYYLTQEDAPLRNLPLADETWRGRVKRIGLGGRSVELYYPGPAHTRDNVAAFIADCGLLFGGCMLRAATMGLGKTADADLGAYAQSVRNLTARYSARSRIVAPGHGAPGGPELLAHTLELAEAAHPA